MHNNKYHHMGQIINQKYIHDFIQKSVGGYKKMHNLGLENLEYKLIWFDDENVKQVLINKLSLGNIGGVPVSKKIDLTSIETWFKDNTLIETFNELNLFKSITI